jgi:hypothetical protein
MTIENILNRIINRRYTLFKPWSSRCHFGPSFWRLKKDIRRLLVILSGGEDQINNLLNSILKKNEKESFQKKYKQALINLSSDFKKKRKSERYPYLKVLRKAKLTKEEAEAIGYKSSIKMWRNCDVNFYPKIRGRKPIDNDMIESIKIHMENYSKESSTRTNKRKYEGKVLLKIMKNYYSK